jgi:hypothetical protein
VQAGIAGSSPIAPAVSWRAADQAGNMRRARIRTGETIAKVATIFLAFSEEGAPRPVVAQTDRQ